MATCLHPLRVHARSIRPGDHHVPTRPRRNSDERPLICACRGYDLRKQRRGPSAVKLCAWKPCMRLARRKFCSDRCKRLWWRDQSRRCSLCRRVCRTAPRARGDQCEACYQRKRRVDAGEAAEIAALKATNPARCPRCRIVSEGGLRLVQGRPAAHPLPPRPVPRRKSRGGQTRALPRSRSAAGGARPAVLSPGRVLGCVSVTCTSRAARPPSGGFAVCPLC